LAQIIKFLANFISSMRYNLLLAFLLVSFGLRAQLEGLDGAANFSGAESHMFRSFDNRYQGIRGYPTLFEEFVEGSVELKNGVSAKRIDLNLDVVTGELLLKSRTMNKVLVIQTKQVKSFIIADFAGKREFLNVEGLGYCEQVYEGKNKLYLKHSKYIEKASYGGAYNNNARRYDEFVGNSRYFLVKETATPEEIRLSRKNIEKAFPEQAGKVKSYFREVGPDLNDPTAVAKLFAAIEQ
jgi:hypothetical protein